MLIFKGQGGGYFNHVLLLGYSSTLWFPFFFYEMLIFKERGGLYSWSCSFFGLYQYIFILISIFLCIFHYGLFSDYPKKIKFKFDLTMFKERDGAYRHLSLSNSPHSSLDSSTHHHRTNSDTVPTISKSGRIFKGLYLSFQVTLHTKMTMLIHNGILKSRA